MKKIYLFCSNGMSTSLLAQNMQMCIRDSYNMGQTDSAWIHKLFSGCPTLSACICARGGHTSQSMIDLRDYMNAKKAIIHILTSLDESKIQMFKEENR